MLLLESQIWIQWLFSNRLFIYLGRRSLSKFPHSHILTHPSIGTLPSCFLDDIRINNGTQTGIFLTTPLLLYTAGIKLHVHLTSHQNPSAVATAACLAACLPASILVGEAFYRAVDSPAVKGVGWMWRWILE
jgi:hypothetical protein